jgi:hypothetical protein
MPNNLASPAPQHTNPRSPIGTRAWKILNTNLVVALIVLVLTGAGGYMFGSRKLQIRDAKVAVAREIEPWIVTHMSVIKDSANLAVTYGTIQDLAAAVSVLESLQARNTALLNSRGADLARFYGGGALAAYVEINSATQRLQHCLEITHFRLTEKPQEPADAPQRNQLRAECSLAQKQLNDSGNDLVSALSAGLPGLGKEGIIRPRQFQWVEADLKINGQDDRFASAGDEPFSYTWNAADATACQITSPTGVSGITRKGMDGPIDPSHPWFPKRGGRNVLVLQCTNGWFTAADSVIING